MRRRENLIRGHHGKTMYNARTKGRWHYVKAMYKQSPNTKKMRKSDDDILQNLCKTGASISKFAQFFKHREQRLTIKKEEKAKRKGLSPVEEEEMQNAASAAPKPRSRRQPVSAEPAVAAKPAVSHRGPAPEVEDIGEILKREKAKAKAKANPMFAALNDL
jgi:hypothetical protein